MFGKTAEIGFTAAHARKARDGDVFARERDIWKFFGQALVSLRLIHSLARDRDYFRPAFCIR